MVFFEDIFAGWTFELNDFNKADIVDLLFLFSETKLLEIDKISLDKSVEYFKSVNQIVNLFMECHTNGENLCLEGATQLHVTNGFQMVKGVIRILYEPKLSLISIDTFTDAWMPIGIYGDILQIDSGIANTEKLKKVLKKVSELNFVKKVEPAESEYFHDYIIHQRGFDMFYNGSIDSIEGLNEQDRVKVEPYIRSNKL